MNWWALCDKIIAFAGDEIKNWRHSWGRELSEVTCYELQKLA